MLWIGRGVGQKIIIDDEPLQLVSVSTNGARYKFRDEIVLMTVMDQVMLKDDCKMILKGTRCNYADFLFSAPQSIEIYREELYGRLRRGNREAVDGVGEAGEGADS